MRTVEQFRDAVQTGPRKAHSRFGHYRIETGDTPPPTRDEEAALADRVAMGDPAARDQMIRANLRLVVKLAKRYQRYGLDLEDMVGEGNLGLIAAVESFDPNEGVRFAAYASLCISRAIRRALDTRSRSVRLPAVMARAVRRWKDKERELAGATGCQPTHEETARALGMSRKKLVGMKLALVAYNPVGCFDEMASSA